MQQFAVIFSREFVNLKLTESITQSQLKNVATQCKLMWNMVTIKWLQINEFKLYRTMCVANKPSKLLVKIPLMDLVLFIRYWWLIDWAWFYVCTNTI